MTPIEQQALALINEVRAEEGRLALDKFERDLESTPAEALCRLIERHMEFRLKVSDALRHHFAAVGEMVPRSLERFIEIKLPDVVYDVLRATPPSHGLEITEKKP